MRESNFDVRKATLGDVLVRSVFSWLIFDRIVGAHILI